jgi:plastocyanin
MRYALAFALIAIATFGSVAATLSKTDDTPTVTISNFAYSPAQLTITQGQSVTFVNQDDVGHTVTAEDGSFDSKMLDKSKSWTFKFDKAGTYKYYCTVHPSMHGIITVSSP